MLNVSKFSEFYRTFLFLPDKLMRNYVKCNQSLLLISNVFNNTFYLLKGPYISIFRREYKNNWQKEVQEHKNTKHCLEQERKNHFRTKSLLDDEKSQHRETKSQLTETWMYSKLSDLIQEKQNHKITKTRLENVSKSLEQEKTSHLETKRLLEEKRSNKEIATKCEPTHTSSNWVYSKLNDRKITKTYDNLLKNVDPSEHLQNNLDQEVIGQNLSVIEEEMPLKKESRRSPNQGAWPPHNY